MDDVVGVVVAVLDGFGDVPDGGVAGGGTYVSCVVRDGFRVEAGWKERV